MGQPRKTELEELEAGCYGDPGGNGVFSGVAAGRETPSVHGLDGAFIEAHAAVLQKANARGLAVGTNEHLQKYFLCCAACWCRGKCVARW